MFSVKCGSFSLVGEIEGMLLRLVDKSGCTIPTTVFRNNVEQLKDKICLVLKSLRSGDICPLLMI